jgi:tRNA 2-thiouridine synthesizing protein A
MAGCIAGGNMSAMQAGQEATIDRELDARGLNCPLPILRTKKALNELQSGQVLRVFATDPGSVRDFQAFCKQTGHLLLRSSEDAGQFMFVLQKK